MAHRASEAQLKELRAAFQMFDKDGSGSIDLSELRQVLRALGHHPTDVELAELMERMDLDQNGTVEFDEFATAMVGQQQDEETVREVEEMQQVFRLFDTDGSGTLSVDELQRALKILGVSMSTEEVKMLMREIDANDDGEIDCDELVQYVLNFHDGDVESGGH